MEQPLGTVTVASRVLATVARLTALATPGVARLCGEWHLGLERVLAHSGRGRGVDLSVSDNRVTVDLYVVAEPDANLLRLGQSLQAEVGRAIREMIGMEVAAVNVHIRDVDSPPSAVD
jgi:uncharacterized alkaline shock family protein YloU